MKIPSIGSEEDLHNQVTAYLRLKYPNVLFRTDMGGVRLTMGQAARARKVQQGRAWPDLFVATAKCCESPIGGEFWLHGLFLELKKEGTKLYLKDGVTMVANAHYCEQAETLDKLRQACYAAEFAVGIDSAMEIIDRYMKGEWFTR